MKTRIISAIIMCMIGIPILIIGGLPFKIFVAVLGVASSYELLSIRKGHKEIPIFIRILSYVIIATFIMLGTSVYSINYELIYKIIAALFIAYFLPVVIIDDNKDLMYLIYILLVTIMTDTFAYFTGYFIGKNKLCEKISPNKTWEGAIGGTVIATIIASMFYIMVIDPEVNKFLIVGITIVLSVLGQYGDLFFSSIKRHFKVKDYSKLIPGHGGILDRLDSIIFVILTYVLFISIL